MNFLQQEVSGTGQAGARAQNATRVRCMRTHRAPVVKPDRISDKASGDYIELQREHWRSDPVASRYFNTPYSTLTDYFFKESRQNDRLYSLFLT